ncbi:uncharacterized protein E6C27_scaffold131G00370 [Cucumis melo var. makuwa]|uniref:Uncharacterized protein n=1 Tax=Cucumis melo var. makuwa TaxID=1194695 RepID=A0A5A7UFZ2_CUCMM|nr:uncharacterized protein E6C27_scaffold131G00370 [Cucumis melo var. makuwa]
MCHKEEDDSRCKSDKKRRNHSRSSIRSINIDLDADEDTPTNKGVERVEDMASKTRSITLSINSKMETCKGNLHLHFNTKNAYRQEEIDEIQTEWAAFVSRFV